MSRDDDAAEESTHTRREYVAAGAAIASGGFLAGCTGDGEPSAGGAADPAEATRTDTATATATEDGEYSVEMAPMGEVTFESVPEQIYTGLPHTADAAIAAGQSDGIASIYYPTYHGTLMNHFYDRLEGVSLEYEDLTDSWNLGPEGFYELDADVHLTDPAYAATLDSLSEDEVAEIGERVGPWFGNYYSDRRRQPPEGWRADYEYYSLWEIYRRTARVFRAGDRAERLAGIHDSLRSTVESSLPPAEERPSVALTFPAEGDALWVYHLNADGFLTAHTRPLGAEDAFADLEFDGAQTKVDYEGLLEADPDAILALFTMASSYSIADLREKLADHPVASEVTAVQNDAVYAQGARYQGPLMNLFQLEMTAKQLYPEQFGAWPGYVDGEPYPEIPAEEQLFDRDRVAEIVRGEG